MSEPGIKLLRHRLGLDLLKHSERALLACVEVMRGHLNEDTGEDCLRKYRGIRAIYFRQSPVEVDELKSACKEDAAESDGKKGHRVEREEEATCVGESLWRALFHSAVGW